MNEDGGYGKPGIWRTLMIVVALLSICIALVALVKGGCSTCMETAAGGCVPMTCHWTFRAVGMLAVVSALAAAGGSAVREVRARRIAAALVVAVAVTIVVSIYTPVMGICAKSGMDCHVTAVIVDALLACQVVTAVIALAKTDPGTTPKPKRGI